MNQQEPPLSEKIQIPKFSDDYVKQELSSVQLIGKYQTNQIYAKIQPIQEDNQNKFKTTIVIETLSDDKFDACILISKDMPVFFDIKRTLQILLVSCTLISDKQTYTTVLFYIDPEYQTTLNLDQKSQNRNAAFTIIQKDSQVNTRIYLGQNDLQITNFKNVTVQHVNTFKKYSINQRLIMLFEKQKVVEKQIKLEIFQVYKMSNQKYQQKSFIHEISQLYQKELMITNQLHDCVLYDQNSVTQIQDFVQLINSTDLCENKLLFAQFSNNQLIVITWGRQALNQFQLRIYQQCQFKSLFGSDSSMKLLYTYNLPNIRKIVGKRAQWLFFSDQQVEKDATVRFQFQTLSNNNQILIIQIFKNFQLKSILMHIQTGSYIKLQNIYFCDISPLLDIYYLHYAQILKQLGVNKQEDIYHKQLTFNKKVTKMQLNLLNQTTVIRYKNCIEYYVPNIMNLQVTKYVISSFQQLPIKEVCKQKIKISLQNQTLQQTIYDISQFTPINNQINQNNSYFYTIQSSQLQSDISRDFSIDNTDLQSSQVEQTQTTFGMDSYISEQSTLCESEQDIDFDTQMTDSEPFMSQQSQQILGQPMGQENQFLFVARNEVVNMFYVNYHLFGEETNKYQLCQRFFQLQTLNPLDFQQFNKLNQNETLFQYFFTSNVFDVIYNKYFQLTLKDLLKCCENDGSISQILNFYNNTLLNSCQLLSIEKQQIIKLSRELLKIQSNSQHLTFQFLQQTLLQLIDQMTNKKFEIETRQVISIFRLASTIMKIQNIQDLKISTQYILAEETYYQLISQQSVGQISQYYMYNAIVIDKNLDISNRKIFHYLCQYCSCNAQFLQLYWKNICEQSDLLLGFTYQTYEQILKIKKSFLGLSYNTLFEQQNVRQVIQKIYNKDKDIENITRTLLGTEMIYQIAKHITQIKKQLYNLSTEQKTFERFNSQNAQFIIQYCNLLEHVCIDNEILYNTVENVIQGQRQLPKWFQQIIQEKFQDIEIQENLQHSVFDSKYFIKMNNTFIPYAIVPLEIDNQLLFSQSYQSLTGSNLSMASFTQQNQQLNITQLQAINSPAQPVHLIKTQALGKETYYQKLYQQINNHIYNYSEDKSIKQKIITIIQQTLQMKDIQSFPDIEVIIKDNSDYTYQKLTNIFDILINNIYNDPQLKALMLEQLSRQNLTTQKEEIIKILVSDEQ